MPYRHLFYLGALLDAPKVVLYCPYRAVPYIAASVILPFPLGTVCFCGLPASSDPKAYLNFADTLSYLVPADA